MKKMILILMLGALLLGGCQEQIKQKPVDVFIDGDGEFAAELVGLPQIIL